MAWQVDNKAIDEAREILGIKYPVRVRVKSNGPQGMAGKYHGLGRRGPTTEIELEQPVHHISISDNLGAQMANTCLWHELTHAAQCERFLPEEDSPEAYIEANRGLTLAFRDEMKDVRARYGGSSSKLTSAYANVSFEVEATESMKKYGKYALLKVSEPEAEKPDPLLDEHGRKTWRVDLFKRGKWNKKTKRTDPDEFRVTKYVLAKSEWDAKSFAKKEYGDTNDIAEAYQRPPLPKKEGGE